MNFMVQFAKLCYKTEHIRRHTIRHKIKGHTHKFHEVIL